MSRTISDKHIEISLSGQSLSVFANGRVIARFSISTAENGAGETNGSECTPRGRHSIHEKIGGDCVPGTVFVGRKPTGETFSSSLQARFPERDWILTRILRLAGEEEGRNKGKNVDSLDRFIYIHGSPDNVEMGVPGSHGCIRMNNDDVIRLYDLVEEGTSVNIVE